MNLKTTYILFGAFFLVMVVFIIAFFWGGGPAPIEDNQAAFVFPDLNPKDDTDTTASPGVRDFDSVRIERTLDDKKETLLFVRGPNGWEMKEPFPSRVNSVDVDQLISQVASARRQKSQMSNNLAEYGLDSPREVVTLKKGDQSWSLNVGKESTAGSVVYVSNAAKAQEPMSVSKNSLTTIYAKVNSFRDHALLSDSATANEVALSSKDHAIDLLKKDESQWRFVKPPYGAANAAGPPPMSFQPPTEKKMDGVRELISSAADLRVLTDDDFLADGVSAADLAEKYGLDKDHPETLRILLKSKPNQGDEKTQVLLIGKEAPPPEEKKEEKKDDKKDSKKDEKKDEKKPEPKPKYYYARLENETTVVRVPEAKVKPLLDVTANPDPLRSRDLVAFNPPIQKIDAIDIQGTGGDLIKLRLADNKWVLYHNGPHATDADTVQNMVQAITGGSPIANPFGGPPERRQPVIKTFVDKDEGIHFDKPERVVSLWVNGQKKQEKTEEEKKEGDKPAETKKDEKEPELADPGKPTVKLAFVNQKGLLYVERQPADGDKNVVTVADGTLEKIPSDLLDYFDRKLPTFSSLPFDAPKDVLKVALFQDVKVDDKAKPKWEVSREKEGDKTAWKLTQPPPARNADASSVATILGALAGMQAEKIVNEKPGDLAGYGLAPPKYTIVVTVKKDDKVEDWIYTFGDEKKIPHKKPGEKPDTTMSEEIPAVFAKMNKSDVVFLVKKDVLDRVRNAELRDLTVFRFDPAKVKSAKIVGWSTLNNPVTLEFERKNDKEWTVKAPPGQTANDTSIGYFLDRLRDLRADRFVNPTADPGLDTNKGALRVELTIEGEKDPLVLTLGKEDPDPMNKDFYFAKASPQGDQIFLVRKGNFEKIRSDPKSFLKE